jgi:hypothetical protein
MTHVCIDRKMASRAHISALGATSNVAPRPSARPRGRALGTQWISYPLRKIFYVGALLSGWAFPAGTTSPLDSIGTLCFRAFPHCFQSRRLFPLGNLGGSIVRHGLRALVQVQLLFLEFRFGECPQLFG